MDLEAGCRRQDLWHHWEQRGDNARFRTAPLCSATGSFVAFAMISPKYCGRAVKMDSLAESSWPSWIITVWQRKMSQNTVLLHFVWSLSQNERRPSDYIIVLWIYCLQMTMSSTCVRHGHRRSPAIISCHIKDGKFPTWDNGWNYSTVVNWR